MKTFGPVLFVLLRTGLVSSCYYDSEEYLYPRINEPCDSTNITFGLSVRSVLQNDCYSCHSNSNAVFGNNIKLEDYADVLSRANDGSLLGSISHNPSYTPMPYGLEKLDDCKIAIIQKWIESGAPDN